MAFIRGRDLCWAFFLEAAKPLLDEAFPELAYSAGLLGYGSDVLRYDDAVSTDHMWGPRFYLFLSEKDIGLKPQLEKLFGEKLPVSFLGYSVNFSKPDPNDGGVRHPEPVENGPVSPLIWIYTPHGYLKEYLGKSDLGQLSEADWLAFSEHRLLALLIRSIKAKPSEQWSDEDRMIVQTYNQKVDFVNFEGLRVIAKAMQQLL